MDIPDMWIILYRTSATAPWHIPNVICANVVFDTREEAIKHTVYWRQMGDTTDLIVVKMRAVDATTDEV
jgi:hypothetical protein